MNRTRIYILFIFALMGMLALKPIVWAEEEAAGDGLIKRPVMEYQSAQLRDPFRTYFVKEEPKPVPSRLSVQGIIWGVKVPQAIINGNIFTIGDLIEGAEIVSIEKKGITLSFNGAIFDLAAPGINSENSEKSAKTEKKEVKK
ncbi:MAG: hypothetical protein NT014_05270 [Candidatus Omnitrophica bacterium]|nr:hypothetical protein [Candidatus Omnitrophota bacterium]